MAYVHDVFLSYRHHGAVRDWVHNHFHPCLVEWLDATAGSHVSVFIDEDIEAGTLWPLALRQALATSKLMVSVYSPEYFRSPWCCAEFGTMTARQEVCGIAEDGPHTLIVPVKLMGSDTAFPADATTIEYVDLTSWNYPYPVFRDSTRFLDFADVVRERIAVPIVNRLSTVPVWNADWPIVDPPDEEELTEPQALPRI